jgi:hypothetical protein
VSCAFGVILAHNHLAAAGPLFHVNVFKKCGFPSSACSGKKNKFRLIYKERNCVKRPESTLILFSHMHKLYHGYAVFLKRKWMRSDLFEYLRKLYPSHTPITLKRVLSIVVFICEGVNTFCLCCSVTFSYKFGLSLYLR